MILPTLSNILRYKKIKVVIVLALVMCFILFASILLLRRGEDATVREKPSASQAEFINKMKIVYVKDLYLLQNTISLETLSSIKHLLYQYAYIVGNDDLYTGVIREGSYNISNLPDGSVHISMLIDVDPINTTYEISIAKNNNRESFLIKCAENINQTKNKKCVDETGRGRSE